VRFRLVILSFSALLVACGNAGERESTLGSERRCADSSTQGSVVVLAASSMANVLTEMNESFLEAHPCAADVSYSFGSSAILAAQIVNGAPADVFISASEETMNTVKNAGKTVAPVLFARNVAEIMVSSQSKFRQTISDVGSLVDSSNTGIKVGLCVATAPCGSLADAVMARTGQSRATIADTESPSVEDLVTKIKMGELDAGIVYHSDCQYLEQRSEASCISISDASNESTNYFVGAVNARALTQQYVGYINGSDFQEILQTKYGFLAP
jgi:molybdate transport system substrate-binding protein